MAFARRAALILLADDDADAREMYAEYLLLSGFGVVQARNGHDALAVARSCHPDVVVTDVEMPRMGGLQFARALRADVTMRSVPVICLSGLDDIGREAAECGCSAIVMKPFSPEALCALICRILAQPHRERSAGQPAFSAELEQQPVRRTARRSR
jgi:two-component system chemotaxis response regulator CheY